MHSRVFVAVGLFAGPCVSGCGSTPQRDGVTLTPEYAASKVSIHYEADDDFYCGFETDGRGPRMWPTDPVPPESSGCSDLRPRVAIGRPRL